MFVICRGQYVRPIQISAYADDHFLASYVADGLIAATATGSTAYAMAAGGPIMPPELRNILLMPVAPHLSVDRGILLADGAHISMTVQTTHEAVLSVDGSYPIAMLPDDRVHAAAGEHNVSFIRFEDPGYFYRNPPLYGKKSIAGIFRTVETPQTSYRSTSQRETLTLNVERPICVCAVHTPPGIAARNVTRGQKIFETAQTMDYIAGALIAFVLSLIGSMACYFLGLFNSWFGFFVIFIAPFVGTIVAEGTRRVIKRRRGRQLFRFLTAAAFAGALPPLLLDLVPFLFSIGSGSLLAATFRILPFVWKIVYIFTFTSAVYARLTGIQIRR